MAARQIESSIGTEAASARVLALAFVEALDDQVCARLAERLGPHLQRVPRPSDEWLDSEAAAAYLSLPRSTLHKLTAERAIPFAQEGPGCKLYFKRSELDGWRGH